MNRRIADGKIRRIRTRDGIALILVAAACDDFQITGRQVRAIRHIDFAADEGDGIIRAHRRILDGDSVGIRVILQVFIVIRKGKLLACHKEDSLIFFFFRVHVFDAIKRKFCSLYCYAGSLYTDITARFQAAARDLDRIERIRRYPLITKARERINIDIVVLSVRFFKSLEVRIRQFDRTAPERDVLVRSQVGILDGQSRAIRILHVRYATLDIIENDTLAIQGSNCHIRRYLTLLEFRLQFRQSQIRISDGRFATNDMHEIR